MPMLLEFYAEGIDYRATKRMSVDVGRYGAGEEITVDFKKVFDATWRNLMCTLTDDKIFKVTVEVIEK